MKRILFVEDNEYLLVAIREGCFQKLGDKLEIITTDEIKKAEELFKPNEFSAVFMGGYVHGEIGIEFVKNIKPNFKGKLIAASGSMKVQKLLLNAGCEISLPKPYSLGEFIEIIEKLKDI